MCPPVSLLELLTVFKGVGSSFGHTTSPIGVDYVCVLRPSALHTRPNRGVRYGWMIVNVAWPSALVVIPFSKAIALIV